MSSKTNPPTSLELPEEGKPLPPHPSATGPRGASDIEAALKARITKDSTELDEKFRQAAADISKRSQLQQIRQEQLEQRSDQISRERLQTTLNAIGEINMATKKPKRGLLTSVPVGIEPLDGIGFSERFAVPNPQILDSQWYS
ncbi:hypothetical protein IWZ01DRAFT_487051 [Phyllosticta capitalensis]